MVTKDMCNWILKGVCSTSGNIMAFWDTNFNMPVPCLFDGSSTANAGFMSARYGCIGASSVGLGSMKAGYEVALADTIYRWETGSGECLNGIACLCQNWYRGATIIGCNYQAACVNITEFFITWFEQMQNTGIAPWEICCNGIYCTKQQAVNISGDDLSIGAVSVCVEFGSVPSVSQTSCGGKIWVEGNDLHYWVANNWEHTMVGTALSIAVSSGDIWIEDSGSWTNYIHWTGCDGCVYRAPWKICQFCSTFSNGAPANPAPGASCKGMIWMDNQFGGTHLSYIGCDGNKYLAGAGSYPYVAP